ESPASSVVHAIVAADGVIDLARAPEMTGGVTSLPIVTLTPALVVRLPAASRATAESVWLPLAAVVVFHGVEYGAAITSAPRFAPSSLNCTPTTATLSVAAATTETVPDTLAFGKIGRASCREGW